MFTEEAMQLPLEEGLAIFDQRLMEAQEKLKTAGFYMAEKPAYNNNGVVTYYRGEMPHNITELSDAQLGWYLSMLSTWNSYVQTQLAEADINRTITREKLEFLEAKLNVALMNYKLGKKSLTAAQTKSMVKSDRRYVDMVTTLDYYEAIYKAVKAVTEAAETNWWTISRRITQRGQELERDRRTPPTRSPTTGPMFGRRI